MGNKKEGTKDTKNAEDSKGDKSASEDPRFTIPLAGGRVARIPSSVLEQYVQGDLHATHGVNTPAAAGGNNPNKTNIDAGESMITINIYTGRGGVTVTQHHEGSDDDVIAHSLSVDPSTGTSEWHTDWEYGECEYTDESGFPQRLQAWHRHPFGTEYSELYEG